MAATNDEEQKKLLTLQPSNAQMLPDNSVANLLALMAASQPATAGQGGTPGYSYATPGGHVDVAPRKAGERLPTDSAAPVPVTVLPPGTPQSKSVIDEVTNQTKNVRQEGGQSDLGALLTYMQSQKGFDPVAAQTAIRNTPVADYQAQQRVENEYASRVGLAATAAEDVKANRAAAYNKFVDQFPDQQLPPVGETLSKMLPNNQGTLTAFPSGGYAQTRTADQMAKLVDDRRRKYAETHFFPTNQVGPELKYGSQGITGIGGYSNLPPKRRRYSGGYTGRQNIVGY